MTRKNKHDYRIDYYKKSNGGTALIPIVVLENQRYFSINPSAKVLLNYIARQYNGYNNGDLCATLSLLKQFGFNSQDTLTRSIKQLEQNGLIERTRQGGKDWATGQNLPTLFALTWQPIDECKGKLDIDSTTKPAVDFINEWKKVPRPNIGRWI